MRVNQNDRIRSALAAAKRLTRTWTGIRGIDFGFAFKDGKRTQRRAVRFHFDRKRPPHEVPPGQHVPKSLQGIASDVIEAVYARHAGSPRDVVSQLQPGVSIGNAKTGSTGTLGLLVRDRITGKPCLLSNWHVLLGSAGAVAGDEICQPGRRHFGFQTPPTVARLLRWCNPSTGFDAAIAELNSGVAFSNTLFGSSIFPAAASFPELGTRMVKMGAVSELTRGVIDGVEGTYLIDYTEIGDSARWMDGFRIVPDPENPSEEISLEGDSGALWLDSSNAAPSNAVALNFAGEDGLGSQAEYALAHPLPRILDLLNVELITAQEIA